MNCRRCDHPIKDHCKPGTTHTSWSDEKKNAGFHHANRTAKCVGAHCLQPLCSCTNFQIGEP